MTMNDREVEDYYGDLDQLLREFSANLPHFSDGRTDYTSSLSAPVLDCFVRCDGKLLLLERSDKVGLLKNSWNMVSGYLDEPGKSLQEKAYIEVEEETGISPKKIVSYTEGRPYKAFHRSTGRTWYVYPTLVDIGSMHPIKLDWEHTSFAWARPDEISRYDPTGRIEFVLSRILGR